MARVVRPSRVEVRVLRTGRVMKCSSAEARALIALKIVEIVERVVEVQRVERRDMVASGPHRYSTKNV